MVLISLKTYCQYRQLIYFAAIICNPSCQNKKLPADTDFSTLIPAQIRDCIYLYNDNPYTRAKAELGRYYFFDRRLSSNQTKSCASCHDPAFSFTDGYRRSIGALGDLHQRNAAPLINLVFYKYLTAGDSSIHSPEKQINNPMFHQPAELGWKGNESTIINRLKKDAFYDRKMKEIFPGQSDPFRIQNIQYCISSFVKTIFSFNSAFDRYKQNKKENNLTASQQNGMALFFSGRLACSNCHGGINFSAPLMSDSNGRTIYYFNTGLYNISKEGNYPAYDQGLFEITKKPSDKGKYRVPTLRNLAFTAPYFHDGSAATLEEVINVYENGGRNITTGPMSGDGRTNPYKNPLIKGFRLTSQERKDLINFLLSLSDSSLCRNPSYGNPFNEDETKK